MAVVVVVRPVAGAAVRGPVGGDAVGGILKEGVGGREGVGIRICCQNTFILAKEREGGEQGIVRNW